MQLAGDGDSPEVAMADEKRLSRWGIGPRIAIPIFTLGLATWAAASTWPGIFLVQIPAVLRIVGGALVAAGLAIWLGGAFTVMRAYDRDELVTGGVYALVRNPMYAGWITLILPGLTLLTGAWTLFLTALFGYAVFRSHIGREEKYLEARFGKAFAAYCSQVNAIIPIPRFRP